MSDATDNLARYQSALAAVLKGQSFRLDGRQVTRVDASLIEQGIAKWQRAVNDENRRAAGQGGPLSVWVSDFSDGYGRDGYGGCGRFR